MKGRPELEKAIDALGKGDILIVAEWDRATRSMMDGVAIIERIHARGALIRRNLLSRIVQLHRRARRDENGGRVADGLP